MELYVNNKYKKNGDGSLNRPFRSIEEACQKVRTINSQMQEDITVYIMEGIYFLADGLLFTDKDGGTNGHQIIYKNYQNDSVHLIGGQKVSVWQDCGNGVYKTKIDKGLVINSVFENNKRATIAKYPQYGYDKVKENVENSECESFIIDLDNYPQNFDAKDISVNIWPGKSGWNWFSEIHPISEINFANGTIGLQHKAMYGIEKGARFFLQGSKDFLTKQGEFYFDREKSELFYLPIQLPIKRQEVIIATTKHIIHVRGDSPRKKARNITFEGLILRVSDCGDKFLCSDEKHGVNDDLSGREGSISLENCSEITINNCNIHGSGICGIVLSNDCQKNHISGNSITDCGYTGISLAGVPVGKGDYKNANDSYVNKFNFIENNKINSCGVLIGHGSGIQLNMSGDNVVKNNYISNCSRYGISIKGTERFGKMEHYYYNTKVTYKNHWDFLHSRNNLIINNEISDCMNNSQDGGLFESWASGKGNIVYKNILRDSSNKGIGGYIIGIYLDDGSDYYTIEDNEIHGLVGESTVGVCLKGVHNILNKNKIYNNTGRSPSSCALLFHDLEPNNNLIITSNIFNNFSNSGLFQFNTENFKVWDIDKFAEFSRNQINHESGEYKVELFRDSSGERQILSYKDWKKMTGYKHQMFETGDFNE